MVNNPWSKAASLLRWGEILHREGSKVAIHQAQVAVCRLLINQPASWAADIRSSTLQTEEGECCSTLARSFAEGYACILAQAWTSS
jgi:hypothetical protein